MRGMLGACALALAFSMLVRSAGADTASAEALFREGKQLMARGQYDLACPKLADSYRADPATGSLLALALCYEKAGKTASAWAAYAEAAGRARAEGRADRERAARRKTSELEPKLSRLTIEADDSLVSLPGFAVTRDGDVVSPGGYNTPLPVDPGEHVIEVRATGYNRWTTKVVVKPNGDKISIAVPALEPLAQPVAAPAEVPPETPAAETAAPEQGEQSVRPSLRTWAYVSGAAGLVAVGAGTYFGLKPIVKNRDSEADCDGNACGPQGTTDRNDARSAGNLSTIAFAAGGVLLATGVTLFVLEDGKQEPEMVAVGAHASPGQAGLFAHGRF